MQVTEIKEARKVWLFSPVNSAAFMVKEEPKKFSWPFSIGTHTPVAYLIGNDVLVVEFEAGKECRWGLSAPIRLDVEREAQKVKYLCLSGSSFDAEDTRFNHVNWVYLNPLLIWLHGIFGYVLEVK